MRALLLLLLAACDLRPPERHTVYLCLGGRVLAPAGTLVRSRRRENAPWKLAPPDQAQATGEIGEGAALAFQGGVIATAVPPVQKKLLGTWLVPGGCPAQLALRKTGPPAPASEGSDPLRADLDGDGRSESIALRYVGEDPVELIVAGALGEELYRWLLPWAGKHPPPR